MFRFLFFLLWWCLVDGRSLWPLFNNTDLSDDFQTDKDIERYLTSHNTDVMLHRCKNAVEVTYKKLPTTVELNCEILGRVKSLEFRHNFRLLHTEGSSKYSLTAYPHARDGRYFSRWLDYTLRVTDATPDDAGMYSVTVIGSAGLASQQYIFVNFKQAAKLEVRMGERPRKRKRNRSRDRAANRRRKERRRHRKRGRERKGRRKRKQRRRRGKHGAWQTLLFQT